MSTAQAVTPGQGQTVNIAGVEVGEIASVKLRDGKAIIGMQIQPKYDRIYKDASVLLRPKTGLKDMVAELTPGTEDGGPAAGGRRDPDLADAARRQPRRDPRGAGRRHARLPAAAAQRRRAGPGLASRRAASWRRRSGGWSRPRSTRARSTRGWPSGARNLAPRRAQLLAADRRARPARHAARELRAELQRGLRRRWPSRTRRCAQILQKLPGTLETTQTTLGKVKTLADELGPTLESLRPAARALGAVAAPDAAVPARVDADHPRRDPPVHARGAADGARSCGRRCATWRRRRPDLTRVVQGRQPAAQRGRLQPAGRQGGGLPLLAVVGQPRRQRDLLHRRTRTGRSGAAWSSSRARRRSCWTRSPRPTRSSARSSSCSTRPSVQQICPQSTQPRRGGTTGGQGRSLLRQDRGDGAVRAVVLRAAAVPVARVRRPGAAEAEGLPLPHVVRRGRPARAGGRRADLRRAGRQGQDDHAGQVDGARGRRDPAAVALRAAAVGREGDPAPEDAAGRDLRRADARAHVGAQPIRRGRRAAGVAGVGHGRARRDPARVRPARRAPRSRTGCRRRRRRSPAAGATSTTRSATSAPFAEDTATSSRSSTARRARSRA